MLSAKEFRSSTVFPFPRDKNFPFHYVLEINYLGQFLFEFAVLHRSLTSNKFLQKKYMCEIHLYRCRCDAEWSMSVISSKCLITNSQSNKFTIIRLRN